MAHTRQPAREHTGEPPASPFGAGFVAASIVVGAVLLCGVLLIAGGLSGGPERGRPGAAPARDGSPPAAVHASAVTSASPGSTEVAGDRPGSEVSRTGTGGCGLPDGDQGVPVSAPPDTTWEVSRRVVVPRSARIGPGRVDPDGVRRCFAHSPTGAVFAAYHAVAAFADGSQAYSTAAKLLVPGPDRDRTLRELAAAAVAAGGDQPSQLAGFRVIDAGRDRMTLALAMRVRTEYVSATLTMVWHRTDWLVLPPRPGERFGAPYSQHRGLDGYVPWSGV